MESDNADLPADDKKAGGAATAGGAGGANNSGSTHFAITMTGKPTDNSAGGAAAAVAAPASSGGAGGAPKRAVRKGRGHTERDEKDKRYEGKVCTVCIALGQTRTDRVGCMMLYAVCYVMGCVCDVVWCSPVCLSR